MLKNLEKEVKIFFSTKGKVDLFELTYAYTIQEERFFNRTLFSDYWGYTVNDTVNTLVSDIRVKLQKDITYITTCMEHGYDVSDWRISIYLKTLAYIRDIFEMIWWWVPFEVQKRYPKGDYVQYQLDECLQEVTRRDQEIFGVLVSTRTREVSRSECFLQMTYNTSSYKLTSVEQDKYLEYMNLLTTLPVYREEVCNLNPLPELLDNEIFDCLIPREEYIRLFSIVFDFYGFDIPIIVDERNSIYDWQDALYIPRSESYDSLSLRRVLNLIAHEIETHYIVLHNTNQLLWWIKWANNLSREEWLATFQEFLLTWYELSEIDMSNNVPVILMGELFDWREYLEFLNVYRKLRWIVATWAERLLRAKRNYPLWWKGVQHKDITYSRWIYKVREYLFDWGDFIDLFLGKVDFEDISILARNTDWKNLLFPKQVTMRLVFSLLAWWNQEVYDSFIEEAIKKYPFIQNLLLKKISPQEQKMFSSLEEVVGLYIK